MSLLPEEPQNSYRNYAMGPCSTASLCVITIFNFILACLIGFGFGFGFGQMWLVGFIFIIICVFLGAYAGWYRTNTAVI